MVVYSTIVAVIDQKPTGALDYYRYSSGIKIIEYE